MPGLELVPQEHHRPDCDMGSDCTCRPVHGRRGPEPGPRGCWALKSTGEACRAAARRGEDFCNAHSGTTPVAADPAKWAPIGRAAAAQARTRRATLRAALGISRHDSARGLLRGLVYVERERIAAAAIAGATDPDVSAAQRARHALALIEAAEPRESVSVEVELPSTSEGVDALSLSDLLRLAQAQGVPLPSPASTQG